MLCKITLSSKVNNFSYLRGRKNPTSFCYYVTIYLSKNFCLRSSRKLSDSVNMKADGLPVSLSPIHQKKNIFLGLNIYQACERKAESGYKIVPIGLEHEV